MAGPDANGLINPAEFPVKSADLDVDKIRGAGTSATHLGDKLDSTTDAIQRTWSGLQTCYHAPEQHHVYRIMLPATIAADQVKERMDKAATVTSTYADTIAEIKPKLRNLETEATTFRELALKGHDRWGYAPIVMSAGTAITTIPSFGIVHDEWFEHTPYVERNAELLGQHDQLLLELTEAASTCSDGLVALMSPTAAADFRDAVDDAEKKARNDAEKNPPTLPAWGYPREEQRNCPEQVGDGVSNIFWETVLGVGGLFGYNPETGKPGDGEYAKKSWLGLLDSLGTMAMMINPINQTLMFAGAGAHDLGIENPFTGDMEKRRSMLARMLGGMVAIDPDADDPLKTWKTAPVQGMTESVINIGSIFLGGAGAGKGVLKAAMATTRGTRVANALSHMVHVRIPGGSWLLRNGARVYRLAHLDIRGALRGTDVPVSSHIPELPPSSKKSLTQDVFPEKQSRTPSTGGGGRGSGNGGSSVPPHPQTPETPRSPHTPDGPDHENGVRPPRPKPADWPENGPTTGGPGRANRAVYEYTTGRSRAMNRLLDDLAELSPAQARRLLAEQGDSLPSWIREQVEAVSRRTGGADGVPGFEPGQFAETARHVDSLLDVLDNAPRHHGPVSSGQWLSDAELAALQPGTTYSPRTFLSSSTNPKTAASYAAGAGEHNLRSVVFRIESRTGVSLERISTSDEILFRPGTRFRVVARRPLPLDDLDALIRWQLGENPMEIVLKELP